MLLVRRSASVFVSCFFFNDTATTEIYTLSLHDALPILGRHVLVHDADTAFLRQRNRQARRSEEHTSELQSPKELVCRLLLEKKKERGARARPQRRLKPAKIRAGENCTR